MEKKVCKICGRELEEMYFQKRTNVCKTCKWFQNHNIKYNDIPISKNKAFIIVESLFVHRLSLNTIAKEIEVSINEVIEYVRILKICNVKLKVNTVCKYCNKPIEVSAKNFIRSKNNFCSNDCNNKFMAQEKIQNKKLITKKCLYCGDDFDIEYKFRNQKYCSHTCASRGKISKVEKKCVHCGTSFTTVKSLSGSSLFCSRQCYNNYRVLESEKYQKLNEKVLICKHCENEFTVSNKKFKAGQKFCSVSCQSKWHRMQPWFIEKQRINSAKIIEEGKIPATKTGIHIKTNNILKELDIKYKNEKRFKYYCVDSFLIEHNLAIECMGGFWHADNRLYPNILYSRQKHRVSMDMSKCTYIKKYYNISILYLWEYDINNNLDVCKKLIKEYINNNGILKNYHSFNYYINDESSLTLNNELIIPYMEWDVRDLKQICDIKEDE